MNPTPQARVVIGLLRKFPKASSHALARMAYRDNSRLFNSVEHARTTVRNYRWANGRAARGEFKDRGFRTPPVVNGDPFKAIPKGLTHFDAWKAVQIAGPMKCLVLSDPHIPYHDRAALVAALEYGKRSEADHILLNGDIADCFSVSFWERDPRRRNFPNEIKTVKDFFVAIRSSFPKARIIYKHGNHEERYERYLSVKAPELLGVPDFEFSSLLRLENIGVEVVREKRPIRLGKLNVIHGHEYKFNISNPVNPARGFFLRAKTHILGGHLHQTSQHSEKNLEGKVISSWSTGCLCDLHPEYAPLNPWGHGFAFVETDRDGVFRVDNLKIINGKVY